MTTETRVGRAPLASAILNWLSRTWARRAKRMADRAAYRRLATFSTRELDDIGLTREDVEDLLSRQPSRDA